MHIDNSKSNFFKFCTSLDSLLRVLAMYTCTSLGLHTTRIIIDEKLKKQLTLKCGDAFVLLSKMWHHLFQRSLPFA